MHTLEFLIPTALSLCFGSALNNLGPCALDPPRPNVIKYYEPGKSCYKNGIFYEKCENSPEVKY